MMIFSNLLIKWYLQNKRDLPWRNTTNPYPIWLSEIMLQQTRVAQGMPYFLSFTTAFPTVFDLANADEEKGDVTIAKYGTNLNSELFFTVLTLE